MYVNFKHEFNLYIYLFVANIVLQIAWVQLTIINCQIPPNTFN
jgi:hypothetical protein